MKAGAFTPATPVVGLGAAGGGRSIPLNEGGGFHPRNPRQAVDQEHGLHPALNEGGGFHPRNPSSFAFIAVASSSAQ